MDNKFISFPNKGIFYMSAGGTYETKRYKEYTALVFKDSALNPVQQKRLLKFMDKYHEYHIFWKHMDDEGRIKGLWQVIHKTNWNYKNAEKIDNPQTPIDRLFNYICDFIRSAKDPLDFIKFVQYETNVEGFKLSF